MIERINWVTEGRIIHIQYTGNFTLEDMHRMSRQVEAMVDQKGHETGVHILHDASGALRLDATVYHLRKLHHIAYKHRLIRQTVIIDPTDNPVIAFVGKAAPRIFGTRLKIAGSLEETLVLLRDMDYSLHLHV